MRLEDCKVGDYVSIWCYGLRCWDNDISKIIEKGILVKVKYKSGKTSEFYNDAECKKINF